MASAFRRGAVNFSRKKIKI